MKANSTIHDAKELQVAIDAFSEAIRFDPDDALAFAQRSRALVGYAQEFATGPGIREYLDKAQSDGRRAIALAPELAEAHIALALTFWTGPLQFTNALEEYERAAALAPGNAQVLRDYGRFVVYMGRSDAGIAATRRAIVLDPLNPRSHYRLGEALYYARRYDESVAAYQEFINLDPDSPHAYAFQGRAYHALGNFERARTVCEIKSGLWNQLCLAVTYDKLGRHADAEAELAKMRTAFGDAEAYQCAEIYAQWGDTAKALEWLETALRLRDPGLVQLKTDPLMDPLRQEPRFQAIERELKFPN